MIRFLVRAVSVVAALFFALCGALLVLLATLDPNDYAKELAAAVSERLGHTVEIRGGVEGSLLALNPVIAARDVRVANPAKGAEPDLARIRLVRLRLSLTSIVRRPLVISDIELSDPSVFLEVDKAGNRNWAFLKRFQNERGARREMPVIGHVTARKGRGH